ncbi:MAG: rhodanese-like domain-containing protein [Flavobacteriales bacterium]|nr:rhodanese-like domain-containing protein [Flavobacteriales bacterium]
MKDITPQELARLRESSAPHQLIDVREAYESEACSLGGTLIPMGDIVDRMKEIRTDVPVIFHCRSGNRSAAVVHALESRYGFSGLMNLRGGIEAYAAEVDHAIHCE